MNPAQISTHTVHQQPSYSEVCTCLYRNFIVANTDHFYTCIDKIVTSILFPGNCNLMIKIVKRVNLIMRNNFVTEFHFYVAWTSTYRYTNHIVSSQSRTHLNCLISVCPSVCLLTIVTLVLFSLFLEFTVCAGNPFLWCDEDIFGCSVARQHRVCGRQQTGAGYSWKWW